MSTKIRKPGNPSQATEWVRSVAEIDAARAAHFRRLIEELRSIASVANEDPEVAHVEADRALLSFIGDPTVSELHARCAKWSA